MKQAGINIPRPVQQNKPLDDRFGAIVIFSPL